MSNIKIEKINDKRGLEKFIQFHYDLYRGNEYDVPNLHSDEINTLSADKNPAFDFCEAQYFLAYKDGKVAGRVAAIINHKANNRWQQQRVRFGWIDFIDDIEVSKALLSAVEAWGREKESSDRLGLPIWILRECSHGDLTSSVHKPPYTTIHTILNTWRR